MVFCPEHLSPKTLLLNLSTMGEHYICTMVRLSIHLLWILLPVLVSATEYGDQQQVWRIADIWSQAQNIHEVRLVEDSLTVALDSGATYGYFDLAVWTAAEPFDRLLVSWNGWSPDDVAAFKVQVRFPSGSGWSPWLTMGYWKDMMFSAYGNTGYEGGYIDYDYAVLEDYVDQVQLRVHLKRQHPGLASPSLHKLAITASDHRTTANLDLAAIINDDPPEIFIPTDFVCQYDVDPEIGGSICSPTSVVMILRSYGITVDPYIFALDNYDPYWGIFGIWPRAIQNGSQCGLDGELRRYRTWSEAYEVLAAGGRIAMSVGPPLYSGHLMMLAGFNAYGTPIVHDPARQNGYAYVYSKSSLSASWFNKGGVGYTFFPEDTTILSVAEPRAPMAEDPRLYPNYPNPFNASTRIAFRVHEVSPVQVTVFDLRGRQIFFHSWESLAAGRHELGWTPGNLETGIYLIQVTIRDRLFLQKATLIK